MKIASSVALSLFLASGANAFGTGTPVRSSAFGVSTCTSTRKGDMSMRIGMQDRFRRQRFNKVLQTLGSNPCKEVVESQLVTSGTSALIKKCNWKLRKVMIRKVKKAAEKYEIEVDPAFGVPPTRSEREEMEQAASVIYKSEKKAAHEAQMAAV